MFDNLTLVWAMLINMKKAAFARGARESSPTQGCQGLAGFSFAAWFAGRRGGVEARAGETPLVYRL